MTFQPFHPTGKEPSREQGAFMIVDLQMHNVQRQQRQRRLMQPEIDVARSRVELCFKAPVLLARRHPVLQRHMRPSSWMMLLPHLLPLPRILA